MIFLKFLTLWTISEFFFFFFERDNKFQLEWCLLIGLFILEYEIKWPFLIYVFIDYDIISSHAINSQCDFPNISVSRIIKIRCALRRYIPYGARIVARSSSCLTIRGNSEECWALYVSKIGYFATKIHNFVVNLWTSLLATIKLFQVLPMLQFIRNLVAVLRQTNRRAPMRIVVNVI